MHTIADNAIIDFNYDKYSLVQSYIFYGSFNKHYNSQK